MHATALGILMNFNLEKPTSDTIYIAEPSLQIKTYLITKGMDTAILPHLVPDLSYFPLNQKSTLSDMVFAPLNL